MRFLRSQGNTPLVWTIYTMEFHLTPEPRVLLDSALLVCPSLVPQQRVKIVIEVNEYSNGIQLLHFEVDGYTWCHLIHSVHYEIYKEVELPKGWYRVHLAHGTDHDVNDIRLCLCDESHEISMGFSWEYGLYMNTIVEIYTKEWEERRSFPEPQDIRARLRPFVQIVKAARDSIANKAIGLQEEAYRLVEQEWDLRIRHVTRQVNALPDVPLGASCIELLARECKNKYMTTDEFDTYRLLLVLEQAYEFFFLFQTKFDSEGASWCKEHGQVRTFVKTVLQTTGLFWTSEHISLFRYHYDCETDETYLTGQMFHIILAMYEKWKKRQQALMFMSVPIRCLAWKWRAIRNQNHPAVLQRRGFFDLSHECNKKLREGAGGKEIHWVHQTSVEDEDSKMLPTKTRWNPWIESRHEQTES